jgi:hypothetical protein
LLTNSESSAKIWNTLCFDIFQFLLADNYHSAGYLYGWSHMLNLTYSKIWPCYCHFDVSTY